MCQRRIENRTTAPVIAKHPAVEVLLVVLGLCALLFLVGNAGGCNTSHARRTPQGWRDLPPIHLLVRPF